MRLNAIELIKEFPEKGRAEDQPPVPHAHVRLTLTLSANITLTGFRTAPDKKSHRDFLGCSSVLGPTNLAGPKRHSGNL
jgi:hypothetical protein